MPVSARSAVAGFGRQPVEGTPLTVPKYEIPMGSGSIRPNQNVEDLPWTADTQDVPGQFISLNAGEFDMALPVLPISCVPLLQGVLGTRVTTGASAPYTHTMTPADTLPWTTWFFAMPGGKYLNLSDAKIGSAELGWAAGNPLTLSVSGGGRLLTKANSKWGAATLVEGVDPFFTFIGADIKFETSATPATTRVRWVAEGNVTVNRNLDMIQTDGLGYQALAEQAREITVNFNNAVFEDATVLDQVFFGGGTTLVTNAVYGSLKMTFLGSDQVAAATRSLVIDLPRVKWTTDPIDADPSGNTVRYGVTGRASKPTSGAIMTATVLNADAGTNY